MILSVPLDDLVKILALLPYDLDLIFSFQVFDGPLLVFKYEKSNRDRINRRRNLKDYYTLDERLSFLELLLEVRKLLGELDEALLETRVRLIQDWRNQNVILEVRSHRTLPAVQDIQLEVLVVQVLFDIERLPAILDLIVFLKLVNALLLLLLIQPELLLDRVREKSLKHLPLLTPAPPRVSRVLRELRT